VSIIKRSIKQYRVGKEDEGASDFTQLGNVCLFNDKVDDPSLDVYVPNFLEQGIRSCGLEGVRTTRKQGYYFLLYVLVMTCLY
jgi:hypothetical protein